MGTKITSGKTIVLDFFGTKVLKSEKYNFSKPSHLRNSKIFEFFFILGRLISNSNFDTKSKFLKEIFRY